MDTRAGTDARLHVLGISGSPRKGGASARLLDVALKEISENYQGITTERVDIADLEVKSCTGCDACLKTECPLDAEDDFPSLKDKMLAADAIIVASPTYFFNVPGILKDVIDRSRRLKMDRYRLKNKVFASLVSQGLRNGGGEIVTLLLHAWAQSQGMIPVSGLGNSIIQNPLSITTLQGNGLKEFRKPIAEDEIGDASARAIANRVAELVSTLKK